MNAIRTRTRLSRAVAAAAVCAAAVGGVAVSSASAQAAAKPACTGSEVKPSIVHGTDADPDGTATQTTATLLFTNVGKRTCTFKGHPGLDLVNAKGEAWSVAWQKQTAATVTLKPGVATMAELTFLPTSPKSTGAGEEAFVPAKVKVTPPNTTATATLAWPWKDIAVVRQDGATHPGTYLSTVFGTASS
ncbi:DUF4232 domain-containing protein [Streptomyces sp. SID14478]|uniref:DUF4232 domain-containing protein n=1 Tax=Streptomyces sp. SID14478 TaxID=2706073 RepID=UPI0013D90C9B|nr:DUF4232 domain-containing protein [Streptomyces sp. SID14478]NEB75928.1 DUF4232 domain-containing protein [Streptomyces sp. SID14478]